MPPTRTVAGKKLNRSVWSKLRQGDYQFFPLAVLRTPALICDQRATGAFVRCGNQTLHLAMVGENGCLNPSLSKTGLFF